MVGFPSDECLENDTSAAPISPGSTRPLAKRICNNRNMSTIVIVVGVPPSSGNNFQYNWKERLLQSRRLSGSCLVALLSKHSTELAVPVTSNDVDGYLQRRRWSFGWARLRRSIDEKSRPVEPPSSAPLMGYFARSKIRGCNSAVG